MYFSQLIFLSQDFLTSVREKSEFIGEVAMHQVCCVCVCVCVCVYVRACVCAYVTLILNINIFAPIVSF